MDELLGLAKTQGPVGLLLVLIIVTGARKIWRYGWQCDEAIAAVEKRCLAAEQNGDFYRAKFFESLGIIRTSVGTTQKVIEIADRQVQPPP